VARLPRQGATTGLVHFNALFYVCWLPSFGAGRTMLGLAHAPVPAPSGYARRQAGAAPGPHNAGAVTAGPGHEDAPAPNPRPSHQAPDIHDLPARVTSKGKYVEHPDQLRRAVACAGAVSCIWLFCGSSISSHRQPLRASWPLRPLRHVDTQLASDQPAQAVLDLVVPRHRRSATVTRVRVDVVPRSVSQKLAAGLSEFTNELTPVQEAIPRYPG